MTSVRARVTTRQDALALVITPTMDLVPIINVFHPHLALMLSTLQRKTVANAAFLAVLRSSLWHFGLEHDADNLAPCPRLTGQ